MICCFKLDTNLLLKFFVAFYEIPNKPFDYFICSRDGKDVRVISKQAVAFQDTNSYKLII